MSIQVSDVLDFLVARSMAPSTMGAQLDRMRFGVQIAPDPFRARDDVENHLLQQASLIRCIDDFTARVEFTVTTRQRLQAATGYKVLEKFQKATGRKQGELGIGILRAYHEWSTQSVERGLLEVYKYLTGIAPAIVPPPPKNETDLLQAFRVGTAKRARNVACEAYADSLLALQNHVRVFNKKGKS